MMSQMTCSSDVFRLLSCILSVFHSLKVKGSLFIPLIFDKHIHFIAILSNRVGFIIIYISGCICGDKKRYFVSKPNQRISTALRQVRKNTFEPEEMYICNFSIVLH